MKLPFGDQQMQRTASVCPLHSNGGAGQDNNFPIGISMALDLVNHVLKMVDNGDCEGRKGPVEI